MSDTLIGFLAVLKTLKYFVVDPNEVKTVSKVRVSVENEMLPLLKFSFLQLLNSNTVNGTLKININ